MHYTCTHTRILIYYIQTSIKINLRKGRGGGEKMGGVDWPPPPGVCQWQTLEVNTIFSDNNVIWK